MSIKLRVISLGAGVQSTTLALMAAHGEIGPVPDCAIFADTQAEPAAVYRHLDWLASGNVLPFPVRRITVGSLADDLLYGINPGQYSRGGGRKRFAVIPYFLKTNGTAEGMGRRMCTREYKIDPLAREYRQLLGCKPRRRIPPGTVEVWLGISTDEAHRMRSARSAWMVNRYPLIEQRMSRSDCLGWLARNDYPRPSKSACVFCPYRKDRGWREMKETDPESWELACRVDEALRDGISHDGGLRAQAFIHRSLRPLRQADLNQNQPDLFGNECEGVCGV